MSVATVIIKLTKGKLMEYVNKTPLMDEVLDAVMAKYGYATRSEAYPFVLGMATECISVESYGRMLDALK
jgi:hypothetical protein